MYNLSYNFLHLERGLWGVDSRPFRKTLEPDVLQE